MRTARNRRRAVFRTSAVISIAALGAAAAPAAFADAPTLTIDRIATHDDGTVAVFSTGSQSPEWLRINVKSSTAADATTLYSTDDFSAGSTTARVALPAGTAYGDYPVDVDYRLPGGPVQHWTAAGHGAAGLLDYRLHPRITGLTTDRVNTDYDHRTFVLSGAVQEFDPADGEQVPAPAATHVRLNWSVGDGFTTTRHTALVDTDATGAFQLPVTPNGQFSDGAATLENQPADTAAPLPAALPEVDVTKTRYRISAAPSRTRVHAHGTFTVAGSVQRYTDGQWRPFAGAPVVTASVEPLYSYTVSGILGSGATSATGTFSYAATATRTLTHYTFVRPNPYLVYTDDSSPLYVPTAGGFNRPSYSVDEFDQVTAAGRLTGDCAEQGLYLQYSPNGKSGWESFKHVTTSYKSGSYCAYSLKEYGAWDGYYRVYHPESNQMLAVSSPVHRLKRTRTAMSIRMTPSRPNPNAKLAATGTVTQLTSKGWKPYAHAHVVLVYRPKGDTQWYWVVKGYTNASGHYTLNTRAFGDGTWAAYLDADAAHYYSETKEVYVNVR